MNILITKFFIGALLFVFMPMAVFAKEEKDDLQKGAWWGKVNSASVVVRNKPDSFSARADLMRFMAHIGTTDSRPSKVRAAQI